MLIQRHFAERPLRTEKRDGYAVFQRAAGRHDFRIEMRQRRCRQRPRVARGHTPQHLGFALGTVLGAALGVAYGLRLRRALAQEIDNTIVDRIDAGAYFFKLVAHSRPLDPYKTQTGSDIKSISFRPAIRVKRRLLVSLPRTANSAPPARPWWQRFFQPPAPAPRCRHRPACKPSRPWICSACCGY